MPLGRWSLFHMDIHEDRQTHRYRLVIHRRRFEAPMKNCRLPPLGEDWPRLFGIDGLDKARVSDTSGWTDCDVEDQYARMSLNSAQIGYVRLCVMDSARFGVKLAGRDTYRGWSSRSDGVRSSRA